ncbi:FAD:protein FMN transferase [Gaopeijia maritima]|uniref:FAD:protein FMN transferase n=1 Tax=Gaopeijia maritima TaxID=3119007 RepID=A0ABU9E8E5_9BACT
MMAPRPLSRRAKVLLPVGLLLLVALSIHRFFIAEPPASAVEIRGGTMGTTYTVRLDVPSLDGEARDRASSAVASVLDEVNRLMSTYDSTSELSRFNRNPGTEPAALSAPTLEVLQAALEVARRSGGALDVTLAPLIDAWGFGASDAPPAAPDSTTMARLLRGVGYEKLVLDPEAGTVTRTHPDVTLDFSSVAKGYATERVADTLAALGYERVLVEVGGELRAGAPKADGSPWRVALEEPDASGRVLHRVIEVVDEGVATSGDYRNVLELDGVLHTHLLDPRTGRPARHRGASVSVVHPSATMADAWATALAVLGVEEGLLVADREGLAALFITRDDDRFVARASEAFRERFGASDPEG